MLKFTNFTYHSYYRKCESCESGGPSDCRCQYHHVESEHPKIKRNLIRRTRSRYEKPINVSAKRTYL